MKISPFASSAAIAAMLRRNRDIGQQASGRRTVIFDGRAAPDFFVGNHQDYIGPRRGLGQRTIEEAHPIGRILTQVRVGKGCIIDLIGISLKQRAGLFEIALRKS